MIFISCESLLYLFPFFFVIFWPFCATFFGEDVLARQSLVFIVYLVICDIIKRLTKLILNVSQKCVLYEF